MENKLKAIIKHQTPRRLRLQIVEKENIHNVLASLENAINQLDGIEKTEINPFTRTILVVHDNKVEEILSLITLLDFKAEERIRIKARDKLPHMRSHIKEKIRQWDKSIIDFTDGELDLNFIVGITLTGMGYYQTFKGGRFLPPGENLFVSGMLRLLKETSLENEI